MSPGYWSNCEMRVTVGLRWLVERDTELILYAYLCICFKCVLFRLRRVGISWMAENTFLFICQRSPYRYLVLQYPTVKWPCVQSSLVICDMWGTHCTFQQPRTVATHCGLYHADSSICLELGQQDFNMFRNWLRKGNVKKISSLAEFSLWGEYLQFEASFHTRKSTGKHHRLGMTRKRK